MQGAISLFVELVMRYVIMGVAAVIALVNWLNSPSGQTFQRNIGKEQAQHSQAYVAPE
jgi:hypothetical protein